jgi:hypothetical protein
MANQKKNSQHRQRAGAAIVEKTEFKSPPRFQAIYRLVKQ